MINLYGKEQTERKKTKPSVGPKPKRERRESKAERRKNNIDSWRLQPATQWETEFRHSHWTARRAKITAHLASCGASMFSMERWTECGSDCMIEHSEKADKHRVKANYCKSRHCEPCSRARANVLAANLQEKLTAAANGKFRFVTLTLRHTKTPLLNQIKKLYASFKTLRKQAYWKQSQRGGAFMLEVKWSARSREWHPHLHVITDGSWMDKRDLSREWLKVTGDSTSVDVRALDDAKHAAHYLVKYVTKGTSSEVWDDKEAAQEWITATRGIRVCSTFGNWRGMKLSKPTIKYDDWVKVCRLDNLIQRVQAGEQHAMQILLLLRPPGRADKT